MDITSVQDARKAYPRIVSELLARRYTLEQILEIVNIIDKTCHACWEYETGCQCWNDE